MPTKTDLQIAKLAAIKAYKSAVRLRYSLAADKEIAYGEPELVREIDEALQAKRPYVLDTQRIYGEAGKYAAISGRVVEE